MPIYEYKCLKCKARLEVMQKVSDPPKEKCPQCGGHLKKIISSPALQFRGDGFYITDYVKKEKKEKGKEEKSKEKQEKLVAEKLPPKEEPSSSSG